MTMGLRPQCRRKLDADQVRKIRWLHASGSKIKNLAPEFGVSESSIARIVELSTYKEVR